jgi:beta-glucosidase-like glycosyl hydrolase
MTQNERQSERLARIKAAVAAQVNMAADDPKRRTNGQIMMDVDAELDRQAAEEAELERLIAADAKLDVAPDKVAKVAKVAQAKATATATATQPDKRKTLCPVTRSEFTEHATPVRVNIAGYDLIGEPKEFSTGSIGWYVGGKVLIDVGGKPVTVQVGLNLTIVGSKELNS